ncbi:MAG: biopolymer transporter ExbD [Bacteroidota bacterium]
MGLKKRSKVNAEFSMSSLTDIIFLLLIFFMLTANFVRVDNVDIPESDSKVVAPTDVAITIQKDGTFSLNGKPTPYGALTKGVRQALAKSDNRDNATITIVAEKGVPTKQVVRIMNIAKNLRLKAILATKPRQ